MEWDKPSFAGRLQVATALIRHCRTCLAINVDMKVRTLISLVLRLEGQEMTLESKCHLFPCQCSHLAPSCDGL
jgi:hypothetical protein